MSEVPPAALAASLALAQERGIVWITEETVELLLSAAVPAIRADERERIWKQPVTQRLELAGGYPDGVWACAGCGAQLIESGIAHKPRCSEMGLANLIREEIPDAH